MTAFRLLSDAVLASRPAVTPAELAEACKAVAAMSNDEFYRAAIAIGLNPYAAVDPQSHHLIDRAIGGDAA